MDEERWGWMRAANKKSNGIFWVAEPAGVTTIWNKPTFNSSVVYIYIIDVYPHMTVWILKFRSLPKIGGVRSHLVIKSDLVQSARNSFDSRKKFSCDKKVHKGKFCVENCSDVEEFDDVSKFAWRELCQVNCFWGCQKSRNRAKIRPPRFLAWNRQICDFWTPVNFCII